MDGRGDDRLGWELAAESIVVRIRWFGIAMGCVLVGSLVGLRDPRAVLGLLALGAAYAALDTASHRRGEVFLKRRPLSVSAMESAFIALLCYNDTGVDSPFRWYYLLSLICCALRYRPTIAWTTFGLHCASLAALAGALGGREALERLPLTAVVLAWATWAVAALAGVLKATGARLERANAELQRYGAELEGAGRRAHRGVAGVSGAADPPGEDGGVRAAGRGDRARGRQPAGGAEQPDPDPPAARAGRLHGREAGDRRQAGRADPADRPRIGGLRPPGPSAAEPVRLADAVDEAIAIAKYYQRTKDRAIAVDVPAALPAVFAARDHLAQVVLNLLLNAIDATESGGRISLEARAAGDAVELRVADDGRGLDPADLPRLFQPYFTTKARGTGLGLFVSRQVVEELGGTLAHEPGPGPGTTFAIRLPARWVGPDRPLLACRFHARARDLAPATPPAR